MIDTVFRVETPEGIDLGIRPAGPAARGLALAMDVGIRQSLSLAIGIPLFVAGEAGLGLWLVVVFAMEWFYPVLFEVFARGQTPGKRAVGLRVVNLDGTPVAPSASVVRNLLLAADLLPVFYLAGLVSMLCSVRFQRLGDLAAGTLVIHVGADEQGVAPTDEADWGSAPPPLPLLPDEERAVVHLAERRGELTDERVDELAAVLAPLTGDGSARSLLRIANGLAGRG